MYNNSSQLSDASEDSRSLGQMKNIIQSKLQDHGVIDNIQIQLRQDIVQMLGGQFMEKKPPPILQIDKNLTELSHKKEMKHHSSQTDNDVETYEQRMGKIERDYLNKVDYFSIGSTKSLEDKITKIKRECEERYQVQLKAEIERVRNIELADTKIEEKNRNHRILQEEKKRLQNEYQTKLDELKERETSILRRLTLRMQELEKDQLQQRTKIIAELDNLEKEKIKFHRHKCQESDVVKESLLELEKQKKDLQQELKETLSERQNYRKNHLELQELNIQKREQQENKPSHQDKLDDYKQINYYKEVLMFMLQKQISIMERQRAYNNSECESLQKETLILQKENLQLRDTIEKQQNLNNKYKDELDIEKDHSNKQERQIQSLDLERSKLVQQVKDLEQRINIIREEQINTHKIYSHDVGKQHQNQMSREKEMILNIQEQAYIFREERQQLVQAQSELEQRIEELMQEREQLRQIIRDYKWQQQQAKMENQLTQ